MNDDIMNDDDIVTELHGWAYMIDHSQGSGAVMMVSGDPFTRAANEIEMLRAENEALKKCGDVMASQMKIVEGFIGKTLESPKTWELLRQGVNSVKQDAS